MKVKTFQCSTSEQMRHKLGESTSDGFLPTLGIVFASIKQDIQALCKIMDDAGISIFGATTAGEFIDGNITDGGIAVMLLDISKDYFKVVIQDMSETSTEEATQAVGIAGKELFANPAYIIAADGFNAQGFATDGTVIVKGIEECVGENKIIFGGIAGDDLTVTGTYVFTNERICAGGIVALILDSDHVNVAGVAIGGWQPVGAVHTITKSEGPVIYTINDEPALDFICKFTGLNYDTPGRLQYNFGDFSPIQLIKANGTSVLRETRALNGADRSVIYSGNIEQDAKFRFSLPPDFDVIDKVIADCIYIKENEQEDADAIIVFSCPMRRITFGPMIKEEIEGVQRVWNKPLVGICTYGEIGKSIGDKTEFHNNTCCVVTLKEKLLTTEI